MLALFDGDILTHRVGYGCQHKVTADEAEFDSTLVEGELSVLPIEVAIARIDELITNICACIKASEYTVYLSDDKINFRKQLYSDYKANRKDVVRPVHLAALREHLITTHHAVVGIAEEADDLLGIKQRDCFDVDQPSIIVTIDKDLLQVPGLHYNFVRGEYNDVDEAGGQYYFYKQILMGDATDNIPGCRGIGDKKSDKILSPYIGNELELYRAVFECYKEQNNKLSSDEVEKLILKSGQLVCIRQRVGEVWELPLFN